jgi:DNA-binding MarR family transcriptional regulator
MSNQAAVPFATTARIREQCLCLHVQRAARALARRFDAALHPLNLTNGQFSLLMSLNRPQAPGMGSIAALLAMDRTTLTAALKPLLRRRLVRVVPDPADARARLITLTRAGRALLGDAVPVWERTHASLDALLGSTGGSNLRSKLRALS